MKVAAIIVAMLIILCYQCQADEIVFGSGYSNGSPLAYGSQDPSVQVRTLPNGSWINAYVCLPFKNGFAEQAGSSWISFYENNGMGYSQYTQFEYQTLFTLPDGISGRSLSLTYAVDDRMAIYLNDQLIGDGGYWLNFSNITCNNDSYFQTGENVLRFEVDNLGDPTGINYLAEINYSVPEPPTLLALCGGVAGILTLRRRR